MFIMVFCEDLGLALWVIFRSHHCLWSAAQRLNTGWLQDKDGQMKSDHIHIRESCVGQFQNEVSQKSQTKDQASVLFLQQKLEVAGTY